MERKRAMFEKYNNFERVGNSLTGIFDDGHDYPVADIDTPFLTTIKGGDGLDECGAASV